MDRYIPVVLNSSLILFRFIGNNGRKDAGNWAHGLHGHSTPQGSRSLPARITRFLPFLAFRRCARATAELQLSEILVPHQADPRKAGGAELTQLRNTGAVDSASFRRSWDPLV